MTGTLKSPIKDGAAQRNHRVLLRCIGMFFALITQHAQAATATDCRADSSDAAVHIKQVWDGDTVQLTDGRKLRFIGLDAPELGRDGAAPQPYALQARDYLRARLASNAVLKLRYDVERTDRYGRALAHVFFNDGSNVAAELQQRGLAGVLIIPPNVQLASCYQAAERDAQRQRSGIWSLPAQQPQDSATLKADARGFHRLRGRVLRIGDSRDARWINLTGSVAVRIARKDLRYFDDLPWKTLIGREILVRGMIYQRNGQRRLTVRHPAALQILGS